MEKADWDSIQAVRRTFPHADAVPLACGFSITVFNIGGNKYRLLTRIYYEHRRVIIKMILTHRDYDTNRWKVQLCRE